MIEKRLFFSTFSRVHLSITVTVNVYGLFSSSPVAISILAGWVDPNPPVSKPEVIDLSFTFITLEFGEGCDFRPGNPPVPPENSNRVAIFAVSGVFRNYGTAHALAFQECGRE